MLGSLLNGSTAGRLLFIRSLGHLETSKHTVVGLGVAVYIGHEQFLLAQGHFGNMTHQLLVGFVTFLSNRKVGNHGGQSGSDSAVQCRNATATGNGVTACYFIQELFYC